MRVLHVIPSISRKRGGPSTAIISMVRELRINGIDASILTTNDNVNHRECDFPLGSWFWIEDVPVLMFPSIDNRLRVISEYLISPALTYWLIRNIKAYDALHIHSVFSYCSTTSMLVARFTKTPYVVRTIGQLNKWSLLQSRLRKLLMLLIVERANLMNARAIHVTSEYEKLELMSVCKSKKVLCLELGVEIPKLLPFKSHNPANQIRFVFLSRIHPKKQLNTLLKAFATLHNVYHETSWSLSIAGDGEKQYILQLKNLADNLGINSKVQWMGHLDEEEKFRLLSESDWYVLPSKSENFGLSVVESLSSGLPVIISSAVGISDYVAQYKAGIVIGNNMSLENALRFALKGPSKEMRCAAFSLAKERFSWDPIIKKLIFFYNQQVINSIQK